MKLSLITTRAWALACAASIAWGCSSTGADGDEATKPRSDSSSTRPSGDAGGRAPVALGTINARLEYAGTVDGPLSVAVFSENPPKTRPPLALDTTKTPIFPYDAQLRGIEPGTYWVIAVLDKPPIQSGALRPSPEDIVGTSVQIDLAPGATANVTVSLGSDGDAGSSDAATD